MSKIYQKDMDFFVTLLIIVIPIIWMIAAVRGPNEAQSYFTPCLTSTLSKRIQSLNRFPGKAWGRGETPSPYLHRGTETEGDLVTRPKSYKRSLAEPHTQHRFPQSSFSAPTICYPYAIFPLFPQLNSQAHWQGTAEKAHIATVCALPAV